MQNKKVKDRQKIKYETYLRTKIQNTLCVFTCLLDTDRHPIKYNRRFKKKNTSTEGTNYMLTADKYSQIVSTFASLGLQLAMSSQDYFQTLLLNRDNIFRASAEISRKS